MPYASGAFKGECNVSQKAVVSSSIMKSGGMKAVLMRSLVKGRKDRRRRARAGVDVHAREKHGRECVVSVGIVDSITAVFVIEVQL